MSKHFALWTAVGIMLLMRTFVLIAQAAGAADFFLAAIDLVLWSLSGWWLFELAVSPPTWIEDRD